MRREATLVSGFAHDLDGGLQGGAGPVDEPTGEALISEYVPDRAREYMPSSAVLPPSRYCHEAARTATVTSSPAV